MGTFMNFLLCGFAVVIAQDDVTLEADEPFLNIEREQPAALRCCYTNKGEPEDFKWLKSAREGNKVTILSPVNLSGDVYTEKGRTKPFCGVLNLPPVQLNDSGLYQCWLKKSKVLTHGTYLHVYNRLEKTIDLSESTKNKILTAEGVLLFLSVILPAATLLCKSKKLNELEKKKVKKEEENIYQGLNLDDCCTTYDQIERSTAHCQYEDVCNIMEEEEEIQLEKP